MRPDEFSPPPAAGPPAEPATTPLQPQQQASIEELLALAKTFLAAQQSSAPPQSTATPAAPPSGAEPGAEPTSARERRKFFKLTAEQVAAAAARTSSAPAEPEPGAPGPTEADPAYGLPADPSLPADPLAPETAGDIGTGQDAAPGDETFRRRRGARITPQLGHTQRPTRRTSRLPFWISGITLLAGLGIGWWVYPRLQRPMPASAEAPSLPVPSGNAPGAAELLQMPPLPPGSVAARAISPEPVTVRALALVDEGLAAEKAKEPAKAVRFYEQAYALDPRVPGAAYRLAELAMRQGDLPRATTWVNRALSVGENTADCYALRGLLAGRTGNSRTAIESLTAATRAEPLNSRWYFFLAQTLRRGGKLQEAAHRLQQAIQRVDDAQQEEFFNFVLRLTRIEMGEAEQIVPELGAKLSLAVPPPDWLLTGAAIELQRGRVEQAAALMTRAFQNQQRAYIASRLEDVFFRNFETTRELSPFYAAYSLRGGGGNAPDPTGNPRSAALVAPGLMPSAVLLQQPPAQQRSLFQTAPPAPVGIGPTPAPAGNGNGNR